MLILRISVKYSISCFDFRRVLTLLFPEVLNKHSLHPFYLYVSVHYVYLFFLNIYNIC